MRVLRDACFCAVILLLAWKTADRLARTIETHARTEALASALTAGFAVSRSPVLLAGEGVYVPLDGLPLPESGSVSGLRLVLVMAASSPRCVEAVQGWQQLLSEMRTSSRTEVWVVVDKRSTSAEALVSSSTLAKDRTRLLGIRSVPEFAATTGLTMVPAALLFRHESLLLLATGPMGEHEIEVFSKYLYREQEGPVVNPLISDNRPDPLIGYEAR